mmetsp:Transcript_17198/g.24521  ORF Transcript_17198/g.24521 Transcript_17198/m.24521 type:complete len:528 (-) Transcript_17198:71-1654(-)
MTSLLHVTSSRVLQESALATACSPSGGASENAALCELAAYVVQLNEGINVFFLLFAGALVFSMQIGFTMLCAGSVSEKNVKNIVLKNLLDACGGTIGFWAIGYGLAYGDSTSIGKSFIGSYRNFFLVEYTGQPPSDNGGVNFMTFFFNWAFACSSATIVAGAIAERCKMVAYLCYSFMVTGLVYPVVVHWIWSHHGYLSPRTLDPFLGTGVIDFSGSGVVHITGGTTALIAAWFLGPRIGRFYDTDGTPLAIPSPFPPNSVALQMLGTFILWFGWYGFNPGSAQNITGGKDYTAAIAAISSTLGAASGSLSCMLVQSFIDYYYNGGEVTYDLNCAMNGLLSGLVSNTAGCAVNEPWAAVIIGAIAGPVYIAGSALLIKLRIDDVVDAIPVHLCNGIWGLIAVGFFAAPQQLGSAYPGHTEYGVFYGGGKLLAAQVCGILFIIGWTSAIMLPFFWAMKRFKMLRVELYEEEIGLDIIHHKGSAYNFRYANSKDLEDEESKLPIRKERHNGDRNFDASFRVQPQPDETH